MGKAENRRLLGLLEPQQDAEDEGLFVRLAPAGGIVIDRFGHVHGIWDFDGRSYTWLSPGSTRAEVPHRGCQVGGALYARRAGQELSAVSRDLVGVLGQRRQHQDLDAFLDQRARLLARGGARGCRAASPRRSGSCAPPRGSAAPTSYGRGEQGAPNLAHQMHVAVGTLSCASARARPHAAQRHVRRHDRLDDLAAVALGAATAGSAPARRRRRWTENQASNSCPCAQCRRYLITTRPCPARPLRHVPRRRADRAGARAPGGEHPPEAAIQHRRTMTAG